MRILLAFLLIVGLAVAPSMAQEETVSNDHYRIGPDDQVQIQVWQRPGLSGRYVVDEDGNINMPLVGTVPAGGLTAAELSTELERRMVIMDPGITQVLVTITGYHHLRFTVVGEVRNPGLYNFRELPSIWEVVLMAGGETAAADLASVQIRREGTGAGATETLSVDLSGGLEDEASLPNLEPGDQIVVPSLISGSSLGDRVQVLGFVRSPGAYSLKVAGTVSQALSASGGQLENSNLKDVHVARQTSEGAVVYHLNMADYFAAGYPSVDIGLQPGDTVTVPGQSRFGWRSVLQITGVISAAAALIVALRSVNR